MPADRSPQAVLDEIATHARGDDLARLVHTAAFAAADEKRPRLEDGIAEIADRIGITNEDAETSYGNVLFALERGSVDPAGSGTRALLAGLLARGVALSPPKGAEAEARVAEALVWLSTHTSIDALPALDAALGDKAEGLWLAIGALIRKVEAGSAPLIGRAGAMIAAAALHESRARAARAEARALAEEARDPIVRILLSGAAVKDAGAKDAGAKDAGAKDAAADDEHAITLTGEIADPPLGPIALVLLGVTGILALMHLGRFLGRVALHYRRPAQLRVSSRGVTVLSRTELLGRTLHAREAYVPLASLLKASREVRYPRIAMYTGLIALAIGSYFGIAFFVDGARAGSPELLGVGLLLVALGVGLDFVLENVVAAAKGHCRVVIVPRKGAAFALGRVDPAHADAALQKLLRPASE
jgi:hypothetical protein